MWLGGVAENLWWEPYFITAADLISVVMGQEGKLVCTNEQEKSVNVLDMA